MADKVYYPTTIEENPFPQIEGVATFISDQQKSGGNYSNIQIEQQTFPFRKVAYEVISLALNTKSRKILGEFEFTQSGAIQVGKYENGVSGDLKISPNGIVARNESGTTTFSIDGTTGDAVFKGTIQAGSVVTGIVAVGDNNVVIDGDSKSIIVYDDNGIPRVHIGYLKGGY